MINKIKELSKKYENLILTTIEEDSQNYYGFLNNPYQDNQDLPIIVIDKASGETKTVNMPPFTETQEIWNIENDEDYIKENAEKINKMSNGLVDIDPNKINEQGEEDMEQENNKEELKIRKLLKMYGAEDGEIENFMQDLKDFKDDAEDEEDDFNYLDNDTMEKLKATEQGKDLIMNAPKMAKDELKKAIQEYLTNN